MSVAVCPAVLEPILNPSWNTVRCSALEFYYPQRMGVIVVEWNLPSRWVYCSYESTLQAS